MRNEVLSQDPAAGLRDGRADHDSGKLSGGSRYSGGGQGAGSDRRDQHSLSRGNDRGGCGTGGADQRSDPGGQRNQGVSGPGGTADFGREPEDRMGRRDCRRRSAHLHGVRRWRAGNNPSDACPDGEQYRPEGWPRDYGGRTVYRRNGSKEYDRELSGGRSGTGPERTPAEQRDHPHAGNVCD